MDALKKRGDAEQPPAPTVPTEQASGLVASDADDELDTPSRNLARTAQPPL